MSLNLPQIDRVVDELNEDQQLERNLRNLNIESPIANRDQGPRRVAKRASLDQQEIQDNQFKLNKINQAKKPRSKPLRPSYQKRADLQLLIECKHPQMIPFVRYVLGKAQKYQLDVHIILECIKNSTESELLSRYA